jgi:hypothetical protein
MIAIFPDKAGYRLFFVLQGFAHCDVTRFLILRYEPGRRSDCQRLEYVFEWQRRELVGVYRARQDIIINLKRKRYARRKRTDNVCANSRIRINIRVVFSIFKREILDRFG